MKLAYRKFLQDIKGIVSKDRIYTDDLRLLAWGTDAGFYRMIPQIVIRSNSEEEVSQLLSIASKHNLPVTFRAAGTSLSGQAISDSILIVAGKHWENYEIGPGAETIKLQPGIIGSRVNDYLKPYGRMFSPDPASKNSAMVGGIVVNNASGMNCGTHANSDKILKSVRLVFADGTVLDTGNDRSRKLFAMNKPQFIEGIMNLRNEIRADKDLVARIKYKYSIKNVTGLNLLPFVEFDDPFDIIAHSIVGSEGTLAFLSEITVNTAHLYPCSASAMLYFSDLEEACKAVVAMKKGPVAGAELLDKKSLSAVNDPTGEGLTAVLTETKADTPEELQKNINEIIEILKPFDLFKPAYFTDKPEEYSKYWKIRSGIFPSVGGTRPLGSTVLIEDVAFHIEDLPKATVELQQLLQDNGYNDACIYGHALEGNYHFIISQSFDSQKEIDRYKELMLAVERLVVDRYDGSLKAEHGTGRNMAPFVKKEWGEKAWTMMKRVKELFDPQNILNPGVIFNDDPECYIKGLKPMPLTNPHVDKCIECGFCEVNCVTCGYSESLSARQRIVTQREITRLKTTGEDPERLARLEKQFKSFGNATCAGDGLCSVSCPMGNNTGEMIHDLRREALPKGSMGYKIGDFAAKNLHTITGVFRPVLSAANLAGKVLGDGGVNAIGGALNKVGVPLWTPSLPGAFYSPKVVAQPADKKVVYFPSCINQTLGQSREKGKKVETLVDTIIALCNKAGYEVVFPKNMKKLCCGMIWESKGMPDIADRKTAELEKALLEASENGKYPVLCDQSPCLHRMRDHISSMHLYEPAEFIYEFLAPNLEFAPIDEAVAVHVTCSSRRMGLADKIIALARMCSRNVVVPTEVGCCGFAGDKGFMMPDLNKYALRKLRPQIEASGATHGYSNSRTCEIGLTTNSGIPYKSIAYLVDSCTKSKK